MNKVKDQALTPKSNYKFNFFTSESKNVDKFVDKVIY